VTDGETDRHTGRQTDGIAIALAAFDTQTGAKNREKAANGSTTTYAYLYRPSPSMWQYIDVHCNCKLSEMPALHTCLSSQATSPVKQIIGKDINCVLVFANTAAILQFYFLTDISGNGKQ